MSFKLFYYTFKVNSSYRWPVTHILISDDPVGFVLFIACSSVTRYSSLTLIPQRLFVCTSTPGYSFSLFCLRGFVAVLICSLQVDTSWQKAELFAPLPLKTVHLTPQRNHLILHHPLIFVCAIVHIMCSNTGFCVCVCVQNSDWAFLILPMVMSSCNQSVCLTHIGLIVMTNNCFRRMNTFGDPLTFSLTLHSSPFRLWT